MSTHYGPCSRCGGGFNVPFRPIQPTNPISSTDNYCSKCGKTLVSKCVSCNGTGRKPMFRSISMDRFCSECGREVEPPDDTCMACGGTGEGYDTRHRCY